jgi:hypothetical protein
VPGQFVELGERARVEQHVDPFPCGQLPPLVLLGHRFLGAGVHRLIPPPLEVGDLAGRCMRRGRRRGFRSGLGFGFAVGFALGFGGFARHGHQVSVPVTNEI